MKPNQQTRPNTKVPGYELTNSFFQISQLKQRIQMLTKPTSPRRALWRYALVLPLAIALLMCTQMEKEMDQVVKGKEKLDQSLKLNQVDGEIFTVVENQPEFNGGMQGLIKYLSENIRYPAAAQRANVSGRVFVSFIVTKTGDIADVKILKGIGFGCDQEAIRVVSRMPNWKPASQNGRVVNLRYNLPIAFELEEGDLDKTSQTDMSQRPMNLKSEAPIKKNFDRFDLNDQEVPYKQTPILVKGRVLGSDQKPLPGASIIVVGSRTGTTTDVNGQFMIHVEPNTRLAVSFVGLKPQVVKASNRQEVIVTL